MPDSVYAWFDIISNTCHPAPCYLNSDRVFLLMSNQYCNPEQGFKPVSSSECLLEFDTHSKPLGHHGRFYVNIIIIRSVQYSGGYVIKTSLEFEWSNRGWVANVMDF